MIHKTNRFAEWLDDLDDLGARARIQARIERLAMGNPGDVRYLGEGLMEIRVDCGPGYRVYYKNHGPNVVILLVGGDKNSQTRDIHLALRLARALPE